MADAKLGHSGDLRQTGGPDATPGPLHLPAGILHFPDDSTHVTLRPRQPASHQDLRRALRPTAKLFSGLVDQSSREQGANSDSLQTICKHGLIIRHHRSEWLPSARSQSTPLRPPATTPELDTHQVYFDRELMSALGQKRT